MTVTYTLYQALISIVKADTALPAAPKGIPPPLWVPAFKAGTIENMMDRVCVSVYGPM